MTGDIGMIDYHYLNEAHIDLYYIGHTGKLRKFGSTLLHFSLIEEKNDVVNNKMREMIRKMAMILRMMDRRIEGAISHYINGQEKEGKRESVPFLLISERKLMRSTGGYERRNKKDEWEEWGRKKGRQMFWWEGITSSANKSSNDWDNLNTCRDDRKSESSNKQR